MNFLKTTVIIFVSIIICPVFFACKIVEPPAPPQMAQLPETFMEMEYNDSATVADLTWREFFNDPNLVDLVDRALQNNPDLLSALERIEIARAHYKIRRGALYPTMDGIVRFRSGDIRPNLLNGTINGDRNVVNRLENNFIGFQSNWEIDLWGKLKNRRKAAYHRFLASEMGRQLMTTSLVAEVAHFYYDLLGLDIELETIEKNIEFQEMALELIKIQKMAGRATELAVQQFSAQLLSTKSLQYEKQQQIIESENTLNYLLGRFPEPIERAGSLMEIKLPYVTEIGVPATMLLRRPDIHQAEMELLATNADVEAARAEFFPSLNFTPYIGLNDRTLAHALNLPGAVTIGLLGGITAPIFAQNQIRSGFDIANADNRIALFNYQQSILQGYQEVVTNLQRVENLRNVYRLRNEETTVLLNAVNSANLLFRGGYATYLEVITAQGRALEAELKMTNTRKEMFLTVVDLYRSLGGGWQ